MRKLNSVCALIAYLLVIEHIITSTIQCVTHYIGVWPLALKLVFLIAVCLHVLTAIYLLVKGKMQRSSALDGRTVPTYSQLNRSVLVRRVTGVIVLALVVFHIFSNMYCKPALFLPLLRGSDAIIPIILFFLMVVFLLMHLVLSVEPLFVGLGVKPARAVVRVIQLIIVVLFIVSSALMICVFGGVL